MKTKAETTFRGRYGLIRKGTIFECEPGYFRQLARLKMVSEATERDVQAGEDKPPPGPSDNRAVPAAPLPVGKDKPGDQGKPPGATAPRTAGGQTLTSRSLRADLPSRARTSKKSADGDEPKASTPTTPAADQSDGASLS